MASTIRMKFPGGEIKDVPEHDLIQAMAAGAMQLDEQRYALDPSLKATTMTSQAASEPREE